MVIHPVRMNGTVIGAPQTYDYFKQMQDRILGFVAGHSRASRERLEELMLDTGILTERSRHNSCRRGCREGGADQ